MTTKSKSTTKRPMTDKQRVELLRKLRKMITSNEDYGQECKDFEELCYQCQAHKALTVLEGLYSDIL